MKLTGSKIIMECLREQKVDTVFGYPGGQIMPLYDALYDYTDEIKHVLTSHEQGAVHGADGYARSTGKTGVCFATSGPGATNTVTGIATAYMDSVPMVVVTGQVPLSLIGKDSFQEVDIVGVTMPITKHNFFIRTIEDIAPAIREAFLVANSGRPGPVLIDIPKNLMQETGEYDPNERARLSPRETGLSFQESTLEAIADCINRSMRPVIYAGGGVRIGGASDELIRLAKKNQIPVVTSLMCLGSFPRRDPLSLGIAGMHGEREANMAVHHCDVLIAVGARFSDRVTGDASRFAVDAKIIHIDVDQSEIGKNVKVDYPLLGNVKDILTQLIPLVEDRKRESWMASVEEWRGEKEANKPGFAPYNILETINSVIGDDAIIATDVGQHQMWIAQRWPFMKPHQLITSGGLGTMGFGLGAAIGAQIGNPDKRVLHITGDGSFRMNMNELATVAAEHLPIITIIMKNNTLGMVRQWQTLFFNKRYSATDLPDVVNYVKLADVFGLSGYYAESLDQLKQALESAVSSGKGAVIVCDIEIDESVYPIVPPGEAINNQCIG